MFIITALSVTPINEFFITFSAGDIALIQKHFYDRVFIGLVLFTILIPIQRMEVIGSQTMLI
jgi:hypothetical protein